MATTVTGTKPLVKTGIGGGPKSRGPNGNGSPKPNGHHGRFLDAGGSANRYRIGMWFALAAILMMFTALTSAYIVRAASANDWQPLTMPRILIFSTAVIVISSVTFETAKRKLRAASNTYRIWLLITGALGLAFLTSQLLAWRELVRQGIYVASHPHSSFFYLLTATHGVHLIGGLLALVFLTLRTHARKDDQMAVEKEQAVAGAVSLYWHFMDVLWIYLFLLLFFWK